MFIEVTLILPEQEPTEKALVNLDQVELIIIKDGFVRLYSEPSKGNLKVANSYEDIKRKIAQGGVKE